MSNNAQAKRVVFRFLGAASKRLVVFDFDDTLVSSKGAVVVVKADGEKISMDSATFAHYRPSKGDKIDFGAFNDVLEPRIIKNNFDRFKAAHKRGDRVVVLTARAKGAQSSVNKFLEDQGVKGVEVVGLASSDPYDKARWIDKAIEDEGYNDVSFYDDSSSNAKAVAASKSKHTKIKFEVTHAPRPKEGDYDGPVIRKTYKSDDPTEAVVEYKEKPGSEKSETKQDAGPSEWWNDQTNAFKKNYCGEHEKSRYCR